MRNVLLIAIWGTNVKRVALVGAGNIGSRHLQGLSFLSDPTQIFIADPSYRSRAMAKERWVEMDCDRHEVRFFESFRSESIDEVDFVIFATTSASRREAFKDLLDHVEFEYVLFEKVLFQEVAAYEEVESILNRQGIQAWVNCPRRMQDAYRHIHENVSNQPIDIEVTGNKWGLGSNAVHFADLFGWLSGSRRIEWDTKYLDKRIIESEREGFVEFTGRLTAADETGNSLTLRCFEHGPTFTSVRITSPTHRWIVNETSEILIEETATEDDWDWTETSTRLRYQSELTGEVVEDVFSTGCCELPGFHESSEQHVPLIEAFISHIEIVRDQDVDVCPIT